MSTPAVSTSPPMGTGAANGSMRFISVSESAFSPASSQVSASETFTNVCRSPEAFLSR